MLNGCHRLNLTTMDAIPDSIRNDAVEAQIATSQTRETQVHVPPLSAFRKKPLSDDEEAQVQKIINATETRDWHALGRLAASPGGFIDDEVRRIVCTCLASLQRCWYLPPIAELTEPSVGPLVLGVEPSPNISGIADWKELPEHREEGQVELDVNRSFVYYPTGKVHMAST